MASQKIRKKRATRAEVEVAADLGGRKTFLSGAGDEKADVVVERKVRMLDGVLHETSMLSFRAEVKTTESEVYTLHVTDWIATVHAAEKSSQIPVFVIKLSIRTAPMMFAVIQHSFFKELYSEVEMDTKDVGKKTLRVTRSVRTRGWAWGACPHRRVWLQTGNQNSKKGDIVIIEYHDFLKLVKSHDPATSKKP